MIIQSFIMSQFGYCSLIWMKHNRSLSNNINRIHKRAITIVYRDKKSTFKELLEKHNSLTIQVKNIKVLVTQMYKVPKNCSHEIMNTVPPPPPPSPPQKKSQFMNTILETLPIFLLVV